MMNMFSKEQIEKNQAEYRKIMLKQIKKGFDKVHFKKIRESMWVKRIAESESGKYRIGILRNESFTKYLDNGKAVFEWGELVLYLVSKDSYLNVFKKRISCIPNTRNWKLL